MPKQLGIPGFRHSIGLARWWHFSFDLLWLINGLLFVVLLFSTEQWKRLVPTSLDVFPNARIELLPGVGHWAWLEQPERVAELVVPFLARQVVGNTEISETEPRRNA